jgi:glucose-1-phosphatase
METEMSNCFESVIFDLGGVLYGVDPPRSLRALEGLKTGLSERLPRAKPQDAGRPAYDTLTDAYQRGSLTTAEFRHGLRGLVGAEISDERLDEAWNAMLLGLFPDSLDIAATLRRHVRLALLSNTNALHLAFLSGECRGLFELFERCFFSHELGLAKPDPECFAEVCRAVAFDPRRTLFIDDCPRNVEAARGLGMRALLILPEQRRSQMQALCAEIGR